MLVLTSIFSFISETEMQLKKILNFVTDYKSFVFTRIYDDVFRQDETETKILVAEMTARKNSQGD